MFASYTGYTILISKTDCLAFLYAPPTSLECREFKQPDCFPAGGNASVSQNWMAHSAPGATDPSSKTPQSTAGLVRQLDQVNSVISCTLSAVWNQVPKLRSVHHSPTSLKLKHPISHGPTSVSPLPPSYVESFPG